MCRPSQTLRAGCGRLGCHVLACLGWAKKPIRSQKLREGCHASKRNYGMPLGAMGVGWKSDEERAQPFSNFDAHRAQPFNNFDAHRESIHTDLAKMTNIESSSKFCIVGRSFCNVWPLTQAFFTAFIVVVACMAFMGCTSRLLLDGPGCAAIVRFHSELHSGHCHAMSAFHPTLL